MPGWSRWETEIRMTPARIRSSLAGISTVMTVADGGRGSAPDNDAVGWSDPDFGAWRVCHCQSWSSRQPDNWHRVVVQDGSSRDVICQWVTFSES